MAASSNPSESEPEVRTAAGVLRGSREAGLAVFFDTPSTVIAYPEEASRVLWRDFIFPALPLLAL
ncbi:MAG: carboxylesterase/lipase family protein [Nocardia sp.]|uniref:hypothetical protein n=1 Tax=Nocardia sp. TaxID=1821 RepID=UPI00261C12C3|nr:hypothetical protein [Nocardia sp.]MCU1641824.1 carboxylesterase/lipase family protein [Nocardia sp.]